jgi:hypothetical protein
MTVQDDKAADQGNDRQPSEDGEQKLTEKPEPGEDQKRVAAEMMTAYEDRPTLVLPGAGGMVTGTAVNDWLDEEGNPKYDVADDAGSEAKEAADKAKNDKDKQEQIEKDKALNEELKKASAQDNKGEKS